MNRFYSLNRSMSVRATDRFPYLLGFSKSCNIWNRLSWPWIWHCRWNRIFRGRRNNIRLFYCCKFDKTKVEEKQELLGMLEKYGNQAIHTYAESKGWKDGSTEKMLLHGVFGALMGDMAGGSAASGALSGGVNEYVMGYLTKTKGKEWVQKHPDTVQWLSAGVGAAIGNLSKDVLTGAGVSLGASKWNYLGEGHENTKPKIVGIGVETEGLGHVALTINFEDGTWAEGDYGRYGGNDTPSSGLRQTPIGRGTYITDNNYNPFESDRMVYMLNPLIVSAPRVTDAYNNQFLNNDYTRSFGNIGITEDRRGNFAHYRKGEGHLIIIYSSIIVSLQL